MSGEPHAVCGAVYRVGPRRCQLAGADPARPSGRSVARAAEAAYILGCPPSCSTRPCRELAAICLCHEGPHQGLSRRPQDRRERLAQLPAGREDRRAGPQRRRQVDPVADHGRPRRRVRRGGLGGGGPAGRLSAAGTGARPGKGRARKRHGRRCRKTGASRPLQRRGGAVCRGAFGRGDGAADRRAGGAAGRDRRRRGLGDRARGRDRDERPAVPAGRRRCRPALGRRAAARGAVPPAAVAARHAPARRADQPSGCRVRCLAGALSRRLSRHRGRRHP